MCATPTACTSTTTTTPSYPSGSDTLFGASAFLLGLPLIWAFQPFNAFMLASAAGPAWLLMRRMGLDGGWAALAALSATVPALVYGYELIGSIKEITALGMILALGALVILHRRWLWGRPTGVIPFALVAAAGVSALGVGFGAWVLATALILAVVMIGGIAAQARRARPALALIAIGALVAFLAALPTWAAVSGSLKIAQNIAATGNPGNLLKPLQTVQVLGVWLWGSYKNPPRDGELTATTVLMAVTLLAVALGVVAPHPQARLCAERLDRTAPAGMACAERGQHHMGRGQDAHADLARGDGAGVGRSRHAAPLPPVARGAGDGAGTGRRRGRLRRDAVPRRQPGADRAL